MSDQVELRSNTATAAEIVDHLRRCDDGFIPRLSDRVDIGDYALKIADRAERFEAWADGTLVGLVAAYGDGEAHGGYITSVSVVPDYQRQGLASRLLAECVGFVRRQGLERVSLEVDTGNRAAIELYERKGFTVVSVDGRTMTMQLDTRGDEQVGNQP